MSGISGGGGGGAASPGNAAAGVVGEGGAAATALGATSCQAASWGWSTAAVGESGLGCASAALGGANCASGGLPIPSSTISSPYSPRDSTCVTAASRELATFCMPFSRDSLKRSFRLDLGVGLPSPPKSQTVSCLCALAGSGKQGPRRSLRARGWAGRAGRTSGSTKSPSGVKCSSRKSTTLDLTVDTARTTPETHWSWGPSRSE
mmetsp:Transcript_4446/g.10755  ORF Transcript_4446/g.10755 Transcript_4446/m.10755 type:complete len:205 (-) Transcript_4446:1977-2591(-)